MCYNGILTNVLLEFLLWTFNNDLTMKIGIVCYPTFGGSGVVATELGLGLADLQKAGKAYGISP